MKSGVVLSCRDSPVPSARSERRTREGEVEARDCASVAGEFEARSVQECEYVLGFWSTGAVVRDGWVAAVKDAVSATEEEVEKTSLETGLEEG